jgi:hypothetical protein
MLLTYCRNEEGGEQLFLLPKGTLEAWLRPVGRDGAWVYESEQAEADMTPDFERVKGAPVRELLLDQLAEMLGVSRQELGSVPFLEIAKHAAPPPANRRQRHPRSRQRTCQRRSDIASAGRSNIASVLNA